MSQAGQYRAVLPAIGVEVQGEDSVIGQGKAIEGPARSFGTGVVDKHNSMRDPPSVECIVETGGQLLERLAIAINRHDNRKIDFTLTTAAIHA